MKVFERFEKIYQADAHIEACPPEIYPGHSILSGQVPVSYSGKSYNRGVYRFHDFQKADFWTKICCSIFPEKRGVLFCFSYDWLGRQFAFDINDLNTIYMVDIDQGEVLSLPSNVADFHNIELVEKADDILAVRAFDAFFGEKGTMGPYRSVGYKKPLFLGGRDEKANQEVTDMEVYWQLGAQLLDQVRPVASGTRVSSIKLLTENP